jgi:hypothetical protein
VKQVLQRAPTEVVSTYVLEADRFSDGALPTEMLSTYVLLTGAPVKSLVK